MKILLIDNYDSFTYNLYHLVRRVCGNAHEVEVVLNDKVERGDVLRSDAVIISPGPGIPEEAGKVLSLIREFASTLPILGICLGHQAIAEAFGAKLYACEKPLHGVRTRIEIVDNTTLFRGMESYIYGGRYHSWLVDKASLPPILKVTAVDEEGAVMALSHTEFPVHGVQFHPESFMTDRGVEIIQHFLF